MSVNKSLLSSFQWPWQYGFPPFFTLQRNVDTRAKQLDAWCDLVLDYHRHNKTYTMDVQEAQTTPLFYNSKINRILFTIKYITRRSLIHYYGTSWLL